MSSDSDPETWYASISRHMKTIRSGPAIVATVSQKAGSISCSAILGDWVQVVRADSHQFRPWNLVCWPFCTREDDPVWSRHCFSWMAIDVIQGSHCKAAKPKKSSNWSNTAPFAQYFVCCWSCWIWQKKCQDREVMKPDNKQKPPVFDQKVKTW